MELNRFDAIRATHAEASTILPRRQVRRLIHTTAPRMHVRPGWDSVITGLILETAHRRFCPLSNRW
jgi:hypothetical protein